MSREEYMRLEYEDEAGVIQWTYVKKSERESLRRVQARLSKHSVKVNQDRLV